MVNDEKTYVVRVAVKHPDFDPSVLTRAIGLEPRRAWRFDDPIRTPRGDVVGGTYGYSMWTWRHESDRTKPVNQIITALVTRFESVEDVLRDILLTGGSAQVIVDLMGNCNTGFVVDTSLMYRMSSLGLTLSVEVFPR